MRRIGSDVQNFPPWAAILASLFAQANDWELAFQIRNSSSLTLYQLRACGLSFGFPFKLLIQFSITTP